MKTVYSEGTLWYLASPYTHDDGRVQEQRAYEAAKVTARLFADGVWAFSPIVHSHPLNEHLPAGYGTDWAAFARFDVEMISRCDGLIVLLLDGWDQSVGVKAEIEYAQAMGLPVYSVMPNADGDLRVDRGCPLDRKDAA